MGILQLYPQNEFFEGAALNDFRPGQFCWIPSPHIDPIPRILDVERSQPEEHEKVSFTIRNANQNKDFHCRDRSLPIKNLNLKSHEELLIQKAKRRLGIILASEVDIFPEIHNLLRRQGKKHLQEDVIFVIPAYSCQKELYGGGFPEKMVARIRCLFYRQFFYFPAKPPLNEGIARFDRIQVIVSKDPSAVRPIEFALSREVFGLFLSMFLYCISGEKTEELMAIQEIVKEAYQLDMDRL